MAYLPYASVTQPNIKTAIIKIAVVCQFLDAGFAEYFRLVISLLPSTTLKLQGIREQIHSRQSDNRKEIGPFGKYCERINSTKTTGEKQALMEKYLARATGDGIQPYLQDGLEVPYWNMMADEFIRSNYINNQFTYDAILSMINDKRREIRLRLQQIKQKWPDDLPQEIEDGIARRISILDAMLAQTSDKYDNLEEQQVQVPQRSPTSGLMPGSPAADPPMAAPASLTANPSATDDITDLVSTLLFKL